jgi:putative CocE/NonD family hydrolase
MPEEVSHWTVILEMRDGAKIGTEVYLPAGAGPWPVILTRTSRGRVDSALDFGDPILESGEFAFVGQDTYPEGYDRRSDRRDVGEDGYDTIEWIAAQPWCNGKVAITGYSECGMTSKSALLTKPPHLKACITSIITVTSDPKYSAGRGRRFGRGGQRG